MQNLKLTAKKTMFIGIGVLFSLLFVLYFLKCHYDSKRFHSHRTEIKLQKIYNGILIYVYKYGEYPPALKSLTKESITEQYLYDIKPQNAFLETFVHDDDNYKKALFLYDNLLNLHQKYHENRIIVAEPADVDNMRYVIYTKNIYEFAKQIDGFKKNPELLLPFYFRTRDDSVKRIPEREFQEQIKRQGWNF